MGGTAMKAEELKQELLKLVFYREPEDDDIIYLRLSQLCEVVQQYADEVSREAFNDARIHNGYEHTQYEYSTFNDWLKEQEKEEFCSYHGHSKESIRDNVLDCHAHLAVPPMLLLSNNYIHANCIQGNYLDL